MTEMITFQPKQQPAYIKVFGVGGGGSNALNHMYNQGINGVDFVVCNTDVQALNSSPVPVKIVLGNRTLGAGSKPEVGRIAAAESIDKIKEALNDDTQMVFITAGMGGGTGTGAAPIIAEAASELGVLSVGIVTLPFMWEGRRRRQQAETGIAEMRKHVDSLIVICNDKLREVYGDLSVPEAFAKADNVLTSAAKGIAEIITVTGYVNVDFEDVKTVMQDSGKAIMGSALAEGEGRALKAIEEAMSSPLLNDNDIKGAQNILLYIMTGSVDLKMDEITEITDYVHQESGGNHDADIIWGNGKDESLGDQISITIIATGFDSKKIKHTLPETRVIGAVGGDYKKPEKAEKTELQEKAEEEIAAETKPKKGFESVRNITIEKEHKKLPKIKITRVEDPVKKTEPWEKIKASGTEPSAEKIEGKKIIHQLEDDKPAPESPKSEKKEEPQTFFGLKDQSHLSIQRTVYTQNPEPEKDEGIKDSENDDQIAKNSKVRSQRLKEMSMFKRSQQELEETPAYIRRKVELDDSTPSKDEKISRYTLGKDNKDNPDIRPDNQFLHDNVD
jgi:cell division protein FtsZ